MPHHERSTDGPLDAPAPRRARRDAARADSSDSDPSTAPGRPRTGPAVAPLASRRAPWHGDAAVKSPRFVR